MIGYGPLIIEFADGMTNGVVLAFIGACDFLQGQPDREAQDGVCSAARVG